MDTLRCSKCGKEKDSDDFYPRNLRCKQCCVDHQIEYQVARRKRGVCATCPGEAAPGRSKCSSCLQAIKDLKAKRKAEGLCSICGKKQTPGKSYCRVCYERSQTHNLRKGKRKNADSTCIICGDPTNLYLNRCDRCKEESESLTKADYNRLMLQRRNAASLCSLCGGNRDVEKHKQCSTCNGKLRRATQQRKLKALGGLCKDCGVVPAIEGLRCASCAEVNTYRGSHRKYAAPCVVCGFDPGDVHHINGNHKDNRPWNLVPLCPNHHRLVERGLMECPASPFSKGGLLRG